MESACYTCGNHVADQAPFCSSCGAPQIRVPARESAVEQYPDPTTAPASASEPLAAPPPMPLGVGQPDRIHWRSFLRVAFPVAAVLGISLAVSPGLLLLLLPVSVILTIQLYRRRQPGPLKPSQGAKMGALIGSACFGVYALILGIKVAGDPSGFRQQVAALIQEAIARNPSTPEARQAVESMFGGTAGLVFFVALGMGLLLMFLLVIGSLSGALAAKYFRQKSS